MTAGEVQEAPLQTPVSDTPDGEQHGEDNDGQCADGSACVQTGLAASL